MKAKASGTGEEVCISSHSDTHIEAGNEHAFTHVHTVLPPPEARRLAGVGWLAMAQDGARPCTCLST